MNMLKALTAVIYNAFMADDMKDDDQKKLDWSAIDILGYPAYAFNDQNDHTKSFIYIKGDNGGKDYRITVQVL